MRTIVIKSTDQELIEAFEDLAKTYSQSFDIEVEQVKIEEESKENPESKPDKFVSLHAYEELERQLDKAIEERNKLEELSRKLLIRSNKLQQFVNKFKSEASEL